MAKSFAKQFYSSKAWQTCRNEYAKQKHYLCEDCLSRGIYRTGEIVHHKIEIDPTTIHRPEITLNFDNLQLLCRECHAKQHEAKNKLDRTNSGRFIVDKFGKVFAK